MNSLNPDVLTLIYDAASIRRWNDQVNPVDFMELDKQAHKMIIAYVLAKIEDDVCPHIIDWKALIEGGMFEMFHRIVLTDIKPPVFHKMMSEKGRELNEWVFKLLESRVSQVSGGFYERMKTYFRSSDYACQEKRILKAAHFLATQWEFEILYKMCPFINGIEKIKQEIEEQIEDHYDLLGVQKLALKRRTAGFVDLCGQLRFQKRWIQSPRIPETSVLGHMLVVAIMTYLSLCEAECGDLRIVNGFWGGLFHDLPEVLTRDITSPIKQAVSGLDKIISEYEQREMESRLLPLLPVSWRPEITYYTKDEFENRAYVDGQVQIGFTFEAMSGFTTPESKPVDGEVIRCCDHLAAFIEASLSIRHGVSSRFLKEGVERLHAVYKDRVVGPLDYSKVFELFVP